MKFTIRLFQDAFKNWSKHKVPMFSAAISYYAIFSVAPLLLIAVSVAGFFLGTSQVRNEIVQLAQAYFGIQTAEVVRELTSKTSGAENKEIVPTIIGVTILFIGSTGVLGQLKDALNDIFEVKEYIHKGIFHLVTEKIISFVLVLFISFLLLVFLIISTVISILTPFFEYIFRYSALWISVLNFVAFIFILGFLFSFIYIILPDKKMKWKSVWPSALIVAVLFAIGKELISYYIKNFSGVSAFGAAGSLVVVLLWVFYSTQIFLYGAELIACMQKKVKE